MIVIDKIEVFGFEVAIRGCHHSMGSWDNSDSGKGCTRRSFGEEITLTCTECGYIRGDKIATCKPNKYIIGANDLKLMRNLTKAGSDHAKYLRMINVTCDITAPLYWHKEFDTYKVGTVANSCSTMHKIHAKEFTLYDFSIEHLNDGYVISCNDKPLNPMGTMTLIIETLNSCRKMFLDTKNKFWWWQMIQLLPTSYNQKRTVQLNYQVLWSMYQARKLHKLDEWIEFCKWIETLPYFKEIFLEVST